MKLLVTGATGQIGWQLLRTLAPLGEVVSPSRAELDLSDPDRAGHAVRDIQPDVVLNAAAYTVVDKAESEPELARIVNALVPGRIAQELARTGGLMIHYSTDYVFDGTKAEPYTEEDATGRSMYGLTKHSGEQAIVNSGCAHIILRTSWVYDTRGQNFLRRVLRLAREKHELRMVDDQHGAPTWARSIAEATAAVVALSSAARASGGYGSQSWPPSGIYHLSAAGSTSWAGFAQTILEIYEELLAWPADSGEFSGPLLAKRVVPITSAEFKTAARRPTNSRLCNAKINRDFGVTLPDWKHLLRLAMLETIR